MAKKIELEYMQYSSYFIFVFYSEMIFTGQNETSLYGGFQYLDIRLSFNQVSAPSARDYGKYYIYIRIQEAYLFDKWYNGNRTNDYLGIEAGDRDIRIEFYKKLIII